MPFHVPDRRIYTATVRTRAHGQRNQTHTYFVELTDAEKSLLEKTLSGPEIAESSIVPTDILVLTELRATLREELHLEVV